MWFDSHCHLEVFSKSGVLEEMVSRALDAGVTRMVSIGTAPNDWKLYREHARNYEKVIKYTVGLHPSYVDEAWSASLEKLRVFWDAKLMPAPVALGEIGLDYFRLPKCRDEAEVVKRNQEMAFREQLKIAMAWEAPVVVHSRGAFDDCVKLIDESHMDWNKVVFHCFSEGPEEIRTIRDRQGWVSFTGILTYKSNQRLREAFALAELERVMLETDSPYLSPVPKRGMQNEPSFLPYLGTFAAELKDLAVAKFAEVTFENTTKFYGCNDRS